MNAFLQRLRQSARRRIQLEGVRRVFFEAYPEIRESPERSGRLLDALKELEAEGQVKLPAKGSWERFGQPPLPLWIDLVVVAPDREQRDFSAIAWAPELDFWTLLKPSQLEALLPINDFLLRRRGALVLVPAKERSLEIFGDEKRMDQICKAGMIMGQLPLSTLGCFQVAAPLPYRPADARGKPLLVAENKDTYWSFGEWNAAAKRFAAVVYGGGEAFHSTGVALGQVLVETGATGAFYFGDLDTKGVRIPLEFNRKALPGHTRVEAATDLYAWLLGNGVRRAKPECAQAPQGLAASWLGESLGLAVHEMWAEGQWLPQEALGLEKLQGGVVDGGL